jgi:hypothetical protein
LAPESIARVAPALMLATACSASLAAAPAARRYATVERLSHSLPLTDDAGARQTPFAGIGIYQALQRHWTIVTFYLMFRETADEEANRRDSYWVARRVVGSDAAKAGIDPEVDWAISDHCPDLDAAIRSMDDAIAPRLGIAVPGEGDLSEFEPDPTRYWLWSSEGRFQGTPYAARLTVTANGASPVSIWIDATVTRLQSCWTSVAPAGASAAPATR